MSDSDRPEKKQPQRTVAWNPEDLVASEEAAEAKAGEAKEAAASDLEGAPTGALEEAAGGEADEEQDALVGQLLRDKWRVLERLGAGSFGTVYKVQDVKGGWIEALKILGVDRITGAEAENVRKRFLREAQIMKRLGTDSAHIVGLSTYEEDLDAGLIYFLMEFVEGKSLADALAEEGPFSVERTIRLALQVCDALIAAHEGPEPVVHRDLKLENLMLTKDRAGDEVVKVLDFGIAKIAERDSDSRLTTVGTLGTPGYAAPEQLRAEEVDGRTDLFAFGVILYALLTGHDPWLGRPAYEPTTQIYELMVATERGEVRPFSEWGVEVPPAMQNVVLRLLRRDPDQRFPSARELAEALKRVQAGGAAADVGSLRVLTDEPGVMVQIRAGRRIVAEGPTPCVANGLAAGTYRIAVHDGRYEPVETSITLDAGAIEDLTLVTTPRDASAGAGVRRHPAAVAGAVATVLLLAAAGFLRPWGRTLTLEELPARADAVTGLRLAETGIAGRLRVAFLSVPFHVPLAEDRMADAVAGLRRAGVEVGTSWEVSRLIRLAAGMQARRRYFGHGGDDVQGYASRAAAIDPDSPEARSLLRKVAERMAWDAEALLQDGSGDKARALLQACLDLVPGYPRCANPAREGGADR